MRTPRTQSSAQLVSACYDSVRFYDHHLAHRLLPAAYASESPSRLLEKIELFNDFSSTSRTALATPPPAIASFDPMDKWQNNTQSSDSTSGGPERRRSHLPRRPQMGGAAIQARASWLSFYNLFLIFVFISCRKLYFCPREEIISICFRNKI